MVCRLVPATSFSPSSKILILAFLSLSGFSVLDPVQAAPQGTKTLFPQEWRSGTRWQHALLARQVDRFARRFARRFEKMNLGTAVRIRPRKTASTMPTSAIHGEAPRAGPLKKNARLTAPM